jgi:hypothetical protein
MELISSALLPSLARLCCLPHRIPLLVAEKYHFQISRAIR